MNRLKIFFSLTVFVLGVFLLAAQAADGQFEISHNLTVELNLEDQQLKGTDQLTRNDPQNPWPPLWHLAPQATDIQVTADGQPLAHQFSDGLLSLSQRAVDAEVLTLSWQARFNDPVPEQTVGIEDPSYGVRATIHEKGVFLSAQSDWLPTADGYLATHRLTVTGPSGLVAVSNGRLLGIEHQGEQTISRWHNRVPQTRLALSAGFLDLNQSERNSTQLVTLFSKENQNLSLPYLEASGRYLDLYTELFGPYPYDKFAVVENFYPTGYGLPGWTLLGNTVVRLPFILTSSLPHEIVHAWWGNSVEVGYDSGNWCEGLATYLADYLLKERSAPVEAREYRLKIVRDYSSLVDTGNDFPLRDFLSRRSKIEQAVGYGKGAMFFHMLRQKIGNQPFWKGLRQLASDFSGRTASWSDLQATFEKVSGKKLGNFFEQWVDRKGAPQLALQGVRHYRSGTSWVVEGEIIQQGEPYQLKIPLQIRTEQGNSSQVIKIEAATTPFRLETATRPVRLEVDPETQLMRRLAMEEIPPTVNDLRAAQNRLVVISAAGGEKLLQASTDLLRGLQWQGVKIVNESEMTSDQLDNHDLIYLGWPEQTLAGLQIPETLVFNQMDGFKIDQESFQAPDDVLFVTLRRENRVTGILTARTSEAVLDVARRIPHYGHYSYLVFSSGKNRLKGTWPVTDSPLTITFDKENQQ